MVHDPFVLFCGYHLGLLPDGTVRFVNGTTLARLLGCDTDQLQQALETAGLDADSAMGRDYDLTSARMDMECSPPGVDLRTLAAMHYQNFRSAKPRDWRADADEPAT